MVSRIPLIAGNWKMNNNKKETLDFISGFLPKAKELTVEVAICPPFTSLYAAAEMLKGTNIKLGAQNMHWEDKALLPGKFRL